MNVPKYIEKALQNRAAAATNFWKADYIIHEFLEKHDIEVEAYDILTGCESLVNPYDSINRIREAILEKDK